MPEHQLAQQARQLQLLKAMDSIRDLLDINNNTSAMFQSIAELLQRQFQSDAVAIMLMDDDGNEIEALASIGMSQDQAHNLCHQTLQYRQPQPVSGAIWDHSLGVQIILHHEHPIMGGFFVARDGEPFNDDDIELMKLAEGQIDSSMMQARNIWELAERNRELEAIYRIDKLGDDATDETALLNSFTSVLLEHFNAELCLIIASHIDSGEMIIRGMVDKYILPAETLQSIRDSAIEIDEPQIIQSPDNLQSLQLMSAPFIVSRERLGAVVVGRNRSFDHADKSLIYAMMSQMDSAVVKYRMEHQLELRNRELEAIYRIDHIRDHDHDFDSMLQSVLTELCNAVSCETGYIMLYNNEEEELELKASTREGSLAEADYLDTIRRMSRQALDTEEVVYDNEAHGLVHSIVSVPLILKSRVIGVFGAINSSNPRGFSLENRRMLKAITSQVDTAVFERLERRRMRRVLSRSVDPKVLEALLQKADDSLLAGERVNMSVLFADLRGSTEWSERTDPEELVQILNTFLSMMTDVIFKYGGTLDKFVGDEVIALFGTPVQMEDHAFNAARAALEMQSVHKMLIREHAAQGKELPPLGVGISSGEAIAGEFGPPIRTDFTAMGRIMNLGSRLCSAAEASQILISETTLKMLGDHVKFANHEPVNLKGLGAVSIYELLELVE